ncbi:MAG: YqeG family HAD IIIA-type phosphatase [Lachnospiraceae bacterium]|nr:YqeG family HAD IIIA-type phosphatase [Lachnospiraceae bacterium]MCH4030344.1 YqeG family HAD IIIA-type phosphatase [Lachnospiraceae bacterium]MCH4069556.1 YqeG family HAD IIIA-type phosphatase [Lachnospiraceae bacterium]MCH4107508.1 YqeG family HAD IIIA-type phosphatase [Lachnospiraceae bacterium]MCI1301641.1 YqeG family HAD IIIA-type phosphatase [Lachnospiraceae bacterium]
MKKSAGWLPSAYFHSIYSVDFELLYRRGFRGVILDIDNTLVPHGAKADRRAREFMEYLHDLGFDTCFLSNNDRARVAPFAHACQSSYICKAGKPAVRGYVRAMKRMMTDRTSTLVVGDQLITDIWGANLTGIPSILVDPINRHEEIQIVLKRLIEWPVRRLYRRKKGMNSYERLYADGM